MRTAVVTSTVTDIDTDARQAKAAACHQQSRQHDGQGAGCRGLHVHWNTPEFPDRRRSGAQASIHRSVAGGQEHFPTPLKHGVTSGPLGRADPESPA